MDQRQVQSQAGVTLVGGGETTAEILEESLKFAPTLVAADGGADRALAFGHVPSAAIGDLDSISDAARMRVGAENVLKAFDQNRTDFEKCLASIEAPFVLAVGFTGGRIDHTLAVMSALVAGIGPRTIVVGEEDLVFAAPPEMKLTLDVGSRLSLFPMGDVRGRSEGLEWPIDPYDFSPAGRIGTSNRVTGPVQLTFEDQGMLVIIPRAGLAAALAGLTG